jgi:hypothetical protein
LPESARFEDLKGGKYLYESGKFRKRQVVSKVCSFQFSGIMENLQLGTLAIDKGVKCQVILNL